MSRILDRERVYQLLPGFLQNWAVSFEGGRIMKRRYDTVFDDLLREAGGRTFMGAEELGRYRMERLKGFLAAAAEVPYWRERFRVHGVDITASDILAEVGKLPVLSKQETKDNRDGIVNRKVADETVLTHTSGTTGSGLVFPVTRRAEREQWVTWWRYRNWHGIQRDVWCGYFGGRSIVSLGRKEPPYWRVNRPGRQIMFSAYHLGEKTAGDYIKALVDHDIRWLHGYPSVLALLAGFVRDGKLGHLPSVRIITTGAESLLPFQRQLIREAFGADVFQHYGQAEGAANFSECENGRFHVDEDYSLVEFVPIPGSNGACRVVGTNWTNPAFPLIRYDTGDIAVLSEDPCPCGRPGRVVAAVDGRKEDYLILPGGVRIGRLDHIFKDLVHIIEAQIVQFEPEEAVFKIVKGAGYDETGEEKKLLAEARKRLGTEIGIKIEYTDHIPRTASGKLRFVLSHILNGKLESSSGEHTLKLKPLHDEANNPIV